jgi:hypothetical protein
MSVSDVLAVTGTGESDAAPAEGEEVGVDDVGLIDI